MPDSLSQTAWEQLLAQETNITFLPLIKISHPELSEPIRVVNNQRDLEKAGSDESHYVAFPFEVNIPESTEDTIPQVTLTIDNVDRQLTQTIREIRTEPSVTLEIVTAEQPTRVEVGPYEFKLKNADWDKITVSGNLSYEDLLNIGFTAHKFNLFDFPSLSRD